jgi:anti-sigma-K factor RskA
MTCDQRAELFLPLVLGTLDETESAALHSHLASGCPRCTGSLAEAEATLAHLPLALDPVAPSAAVREKLLRAIAVPERRGDAPFTPAARTRPRMWAWGVPALAAAAAAILTFVVVDASRRRDLSMLQARIDAQSAEISVLQARADESSHLNRLLTAPQLLMVSLGGHGDASEAWGRVLWEREGGTWDLYTRRLPPAGRDRTYELWLITDDDRKVPAGTFDVDTEGSGMLRLEIPEGVGTIVAAAVTDEPAGGSAQPTGTIRLLGAIGQS